jgi:hypothetical protein
MLVQQALSPLIRHHERAGANPTGSCVDGQAHDLSAVEKATDTNFTIVLPYVRKFQHDGISNGTTRAAGRFEREVKKLNTLLKGADEI